MSGDLVATLRMHYGIKGTPHLRDAADEIERLEAERNAARAALREAIDTLSREQAWAEATVTRGNQVEVDESAALLSRLRAALGEDS